jgi:hypothetical protein
VLVGQIVYLLLQKDLCFVMLCLLMAVQLFILVGLVLQVGLKVLNDALHLVDLVNFILIFLNDLLDLLLFLV